MRIIGPVGVLMLMIVAGIAMVLAGILGWTYVAFIGLSLAGGGPDPVDLWFQEHRETLRILRSVTNVLAPATILSGLGLVIFAIVRLYRLDA